MLAKPTPFAVAHDGNVIVLRCLPPDRFDPAPLTQVFADRPSAQADDMLCGILENIADWLTRLQHASGAGDFAAMDKPARRIALVGAQIGLVGVAAAAGHVRDCARRADRVALAATLARLERAFDTALTEVWNFREI